MKDDKKKKVLIVGSSAKEHALCLKFAECDNVGEIFVLPGNDAIKEIAQTVDIRENDVDEILKFAVEHEINLTVASSETAVKNDIAGTFQANGQLIFAPTASSAKFATNIAFAKKFLYKLRIPTPRFGIFEKQQMAMDYLKNTSYPQLIRTEETINGNDRQACSTQIIAKTFVEDLFARGENKVVIEDFIYGHDFTFYVITDGYHSLPLNVVADYKFMLEGGGGLMTSGIGAFAPDYKISSDVVNSLMKNVVTNVLSALERQKNPYLGILGVDCVLTEGGNYCVTGFKTFLQDHDAMCVLDLSGENLYTLFEACAVGSFADDYEDIRLTDNSALSCVLSSAKSGQVITGLDEVEDCRVNHFNTRKNTYLEYETSKGKALTVSATARTLNRARQRVYDAVEHIDFSGKSYRKDIAKEKPMC